MAPIGAKDTRRKKDVGVVLNTSPGSSASSSPMRQRSASRLTQQREEDPERFRASIAPDPDLHDKFGRMQSPPAASVGRVPPQPSPEPPASPAGRQPAGAAGVHVKPSSVDVLAQPNACLLGQPVALAHESQRAMLTRLSVLGL